MAQHNDNDQESFFVSMTDIMVGLLFIFIILVVYFVTQVRLEVEKNVVLTQELQDEGTREQREELDRYRSKVANQRTRILEDLKDFFYREGFTEVEIDTSNGVLRFPDGVLFGSGEFDFQEDTVSYDAVRVLAGALVEVLPCSVLNASGERFKSQETCQIGRTRYPNANDAFLESVYIEGHTDNIPVNKDYGLAGDSRITSNLKLSARRSSNTFEKIVKLEPGIENFYGLSSEGLVFRSERVVAVSAYGEQRPIADNTTEEGQRANRRIDLRLVMYQPIDYEGLRALLANISDRNQEGRDALEGS